MEETPRSNSKHGGELERIVSDDTLHFLHRVWATLWEEFRLPFFLSALMVLLDEENHP